MSIFSAFASQDQFDPDAGAFINAALIGGIEAVAINNLVNQLKTSGLWGKFNAIYPFVGTTSNSTAFNLINTSNYKIAWNGTVTFTTNGITGNGTNGYGNTGLTPSAAGGGQNNVHISAYITSIPSGVAGTDMGATSNSGVSALGFNVRNASNIFNTAVNNPTFAGVSNSTTGYFTITRDNSANYRRLINSTSTTATAASATVATQSIYIGAWNNAGSAANFTNRRFSFATIGYSLTDAEVSNLVNINKTFQSALGRYVG